VPSKASRESIFNSLPLLFAILAALSLAIWWGPLASSFALALRDDRYTHLLLIIPVSAGLLALDWRDWKSSDGRFADFSGRSSVSLGVIVLVVAILITTLTRWKSAFLAPDVELSLNMLALVLWWIAAFFVCFGASAFRRSIFPLCFLFWLVPLPERALNAIVNLLRQGSVIAAHCLFWLARVPVTHDGMLVQIPGLTLEVAPECSSIRSSLVLVVTTMVVAQLLLRSPWRKALVVAAAIPLSIAKNGLRIFTIAMLGTKVDPGFLTGRLHSQGGFVFFSVALAAIFLLLWMMRRGEENSERAVGKSYSEPTRLPAEAQPPPG